MSKVERFKEIAKGLGELYEQKNKAYGDSFGKSVQKYGKIAALTRISDKFNRLESLMLDESINAGDERLEDTLRDMASYAIMTVIELEKSGDTEASSTPKTFLERNSVLPIPYYVVGDRVMSKASSYVYRIEKIITDTKLSNFIFILNNINVDNSQLSVNEEELYTDFEQYETSGGSTDWSERYKKVMSVTKNVFPAFKKGEKVIFEREDIDSEHTYEDIPCTIAKICLHSYECAAGIRYFCSYDLQEWGPRWEDDTIGEIETTYFDVAGCNLRSK